MNAELLLAELMARGVRLVPSGSRLRFHPRSALSPDELEQLARHKPELLRLLSAVDDAMEENDLVPPDETDFHRANDWNWCAISRVDFSYLTGPRNYPAPCTWCGGRTRHNRLCDELRASWEDVMPYGKHRGQKLSALPTGYLLWLTRRPGELPPELSAAIASEIERRAKAN